MEEMDFTLRLSSPAFVGGAAEPDRQHEGRRIVHSDPLGLRVASLRGVLAFWYRSLFGGEPPAAVYARQAALFGSTTRGQGIVLRPRWVNGCAARFRSGELRFSQETHGQAIYKFLYLGYGPLQFRKEGNGRTTRRWVSSYNNVQQRDAIQVEGAEFHFSARGTPRELRELRRALRLLHLFGGIGSRSRRGWGSVEVVAPSFSPGPNGSQLTAWFRAQFEQALGDSAGARGPGQPSFSAFSSLTRLRLTPPLADWREVLLAFHRQFERARLWRPNRPPIALADHKLEMNDARAAGGAITAAPKRLAFGLPYHPASRGSQANPPWEIAYFKAGGGAVDSREREGGRRASPLILKVFRLADGRYVGVALFLEARFFGDGTQEVGARVGNATKPGTARVPDYKAVREFLEDPKDLSFWRKVELS